MFGRGFGLSSLHLKPVTHSDIVPAQPHILTERQRIWQFASQRFPCNRSLGAAKERRCIDHRVAQEVENLRIPLYGSMGFGLPSYLVLPTSNSVSGWQKGFLLHQIWVTCDPRNFKTTRDIVGCHRSHGRLQQRQSLANLKQVMRIHLYNSGGFRYPAGLCKGCDCRGSVRFRCLMGHSSRSSQPLLEEGLCKARGARAATQHDSNPQPQLPNPQTTALRPSGTKHGHIRRYGEALLATKVQVHLKN